MNRVRERFYSKIEIIPFHDCWEWVGAASSDGYGVIRINGKNIRSHRFSYKEFIGYIPKEICVCHKCDNHKCVNPKHLFLGTNKDNMQDMVKKGRQSKGDSHYYSKLSSDQVKCILNKYIRGTGSKNRGNILYLSKIFNISRRQIGKIIRREKWKHL